MQLLTYERNWELFDRKKAIRFTKLFIKAVMKRSLVLSAIDLPSSFVNLLFYKTKQFSITIENKLCKGNYTYKQKKLIFQNICLQCN